MTELLILLFAIIGTAVIGNMMRRRKTICPQCNSKRQSRIREDVAATKQVPGQGFFDTGVTLRTVLKVDYRCDDCGEHWSQQEDA